MTSTEKHQAAHAFAGVIEHPDGTATQRYRARCTCGWKSEVCGFGEAEKLAYTHEREYALTKLRKEQ